MNLQLEDPATYSRNNPIHMAVYAHNGVGKTTLAGNTDLRTVLLDCGDAGAVTLRRVDPKRVRIIRIRSIKHYLEVIVELINQADKFDLLVPDTITGLQTMAIREVKPKRTFDMNQKKWGQVGSRVIECLDETRNFPKDVVYLVQEKRRKAGQDEAGETTPALTPSIRGYLNSIVDWVGWLSINSEGKRTLDFRITDELEVKDRADCFPKLVVNPNYMAIRKRIIETLHT